MSNYIIMQSKINETQGKTQTRRIMRRLNYQRNTPPDFIFDEGEWYKQVGHSLQYEYTPIDWVRFVRDLKIAAAQFHEKLEKERNEEKERAKRRNKRKVRRV